jgi:dipeptidyl aminopeptidase/acylaminoacyl peptidase
VQTAAPGATLHVFVPGQTSVTIAVGATNTEQIQTVNGIVVAQRKMLKLPVGGEQVDGELWTDGNGHLLRFLVPAQNLDVVREDLSSVSSRLITISRSNDEAVKFGSNGVTLAGTLSKPAQAASGKLPAVVIVGAAGQQDRDGIVAGIPVIGQLADALADAGFLVLRYDKRGVGQSGGRPGTAGLADYAEDLHAAVRYLSDRKDVDAKRIATVGYSEGGAVVLNAAEKEKRIAAVALVAASGVTGTELVLAQQRHLLDRMPSLTPEQRQQRIALQQQINDAVVSGKGLDKLPANVRGQVNDPEFQSLLANDPAKIVPKVKQPLLIVQGELDTQIDPSNASRLDELAKSRKNAQSELVNVPGVNHLLVPAKTGEADEYATLKSERVSPAVTGAINAWLKKTLTAR